MGRRMGPFSATLFDVTPARFITVQVKRASNVIPDVEAAEQLPPFASHSPSNTEMAPQITSA